LALPEATPRPAEPGASFPSGDREAHVHHHTAEAHITVVSDPPCEVIVDGVPFGMTPLIDARVAGGKHLLTVLNTAAGVREAQRVTLTAGELWTRSFAWHDGRLIARREVSGSALGSALAHAPEPHPTPEPPQVRPQVSESAAVAAEPSLAAQVPTVATAAPSAPPMQLGVKPAPAPRPTPSRAATSGAAREIAGFVLDSQRVSGAQPHLPDFVLKGNVGRRLAGSYKICVEPDGRVYQISAIAPILGADASIMQDLRGWRYQPQPSRVCATKKLTFQVP
jgi:hypothetical protein